MPRKISPRNKIIGVAAAGAMAVTGIVGAGLVAPAFAQTADGESTVTSRLERIKNALAGLVTDGTITQDQADAVASTLDEALPEKGPHGGRIGWFGVDAAADAIGIDETALMEALRDGQTLAQVAEANGVAKDDLIAKLVTAAEERLATAVTNGRITQERADEITAQLTERITEAVDSTGPRGGFGRGGGPRGGAESEQAPIPSETPAQSSAFTTAV